MPKRLKGVRSGVRAPGGPERAKIDPSRLDSRSDRPFRPTKSPQERSKRPLRSTFSTQVARKGLRKAILDALGSILGPPEGRFWRFFGGFPLEWADSLEAEATFEKPAKTKVKHMVFTRFSHVRPCAHNAKIYRKSLRTRFSTESRDRSPLKVAFFELRRLKMMPGSLSWACPDALERLLGRFWALLGRSWALLGGSWGALGVLLGRSWALLGGSWALLGAPGSPLDDFGSIFEAPRVDVVPLGKHFRPSKIRLGCELETRCE